MGKIGIITFHFAENAGAALQCFALYSYIREQGGDSIVINYRPKYHTSKYSLFINPFDAMVSDEKMFRKVQLFVHRLVSNVKFIGKLRRKRNFNIFMQEYCTQSPAAGTPLELSALCRDYSACIAGSDQIWNEKYTNGSFDNAYFLDFFSGPKYTYAASVGYLLDKHKLKVVRDKLLKFNKISVRENSLMRQLTNRDKLNVVTCVDPTFLLDKEHWLKIAGKSRSTGKYILAYQLEQSIEFADVLLGLQKKTGLKVINISPNDFLKGTGIKTSRDQYCSPQRFLNYICYAEYIVTNSFHGTVFSIIFERKFAGILHSRTPERMKTLLTDHGLEKRIYIEYEDSILEEINYKAAKDLYRNKVEQSKKYLAEIIEEVG